MNKKVKRLSEQERRSDMLGFLICLAFFACGAAGGVWSSGYISDKTAQVLSQRFAEFSFAESGSAVRIFFRTVKYHLAAAFLGLSVSGIFLLPVLSCLRGFFLSFTSLTMFRLIAEESRTRFFVFYGLDTAVSLPCFFVVSVLAFSMSKSMLAALSQRNKNRSEAAMKRYAVSCALCLLVLLLLSAAEAFLAGRI